MSDITANIVVSQPAQLFTLARAFKANANGKIYIGKIDTDPVQPENRIQVYLENEDGSHVPVAQPLIINAGGYPVYNGQIAKFVTVEGHSMAIYNTYGVQEFYYPNVLKYDPDQLANRLSSTDDGLGDALIGVKQPIIGSAARTQHDKNMDEKSLADFSGVNGSDWTVPLQSAFNWLASGVGKCLTIPDGIYGITSATLTLSGLNSAHARIICKGTFKHLSSSGDMITITEGMYGDFEIKVIGDGFNSSTIPDYSTADPTDCQQAVLFNSNRACKLKINAIGYPGRVLRTKSSGTIKQSFINLHITTGNDSCGQAMYLQGATDAWGCISFANTNWDYYGSIIDSITDISITYWEGGAKGVGNPCVTLKNVSNAHISTIALGQNRTNSALAINAGSGITIQKALLGESTYGLEIIGTGNGQPVHQVTIHSLYCGNIDTAAVRLSNAVGVTINDHLFDGCPRDVMFFNIARDIIIKEENRNPSSVAFYGASGSTLENILISGKFYTSGNSDFCDFSLSNTVNVSIENKTVITKGAYLKLKDNSNGIRVFGGNWSGTSLAMADAINFPPRSIRDVTGISTRKTASISSIPSGSIPGFIVSITHGLYRAPNEIQINITDAANNIVSGNDNIVISSIDLIRVAFKYVGSSALTNALNFTYSAKCEDRSN